MTMSQQILIKNLKSANLEEKIFIKKKQHCRPTNNLLKNESQEEAS